MSSNNNLSEPDRLTNNDESPAKNSNEPKRSENSAVTTNYKVFNRPINSLHKVEKLSNLTSNLVLNTDSNATHNSASFDTEEQDSVTKLTRPGFEKRAVTDTESNNASQMFEVPRKTNFSATQSIRKIRNENCSIDNHNEGYNVDRDQSEDHFDIVTRPNIRRSKDYGSNTNEKNVSLNERFETRRLSDNGNIDRVLNRNHERTNFQDTSATYESLDVRTLKRNSIEELVNLCRDFDVNVDYENLKKHELISAILVHISENNPQTYIFGSGVLEILPDGYGFLRHAKNNYASEFDDIYINANQINKFGLRQGDTIVGGIRIPSAKDDQYQKKNGKSNDEKKHLAMSKVDMVNDLSAKDKNFYYRPYFEDLTPMFPDEKFTLEVPNCKDISSRMIDIVTPLGKGQRALIIAPPRTGKTELMRNIAYAISYNHPEVILIVMLIDERPEEVTDMSRSVNGEVVSSTFDESPIRHVQLAEMTIEKAKRLVEGGKDVVILMDSITRLARAYNTIVPSSGKVLTGGIEANALQRPKRIFGAARKVEQGGSLTIIATALVDTGSKMDEVIFEEFKGTGNCDIYLSRKLSEERKYPAIDIPKSGTRKEERLIPSFIKKSYVLRSLLGKMDPVDTHNFLRDKIENTKSNDDFYGSMNS